MNRTLRRPMFRTGGSAEGITSGLNQDRAMHKNQVVFYLMILEKRG